MVAIVIAALFVLITRQQMAAKAALDGLLQIEGLKPMANTPSAKKSARKIIARTEVNKARRSRIRTNQADAAAALKDVQPELMRAAGKGVLPKNTASRKVSRLAARVKALEA